MACHVWDDRFAPKCIGYGCCPCHYTTLKTLLCVLSSTVSWGALSHDEREHQPARSLVVHRPDAHPHRHRHLADEAPQKLLRGQETGVMSSWPAAPLGNNVNMLDTDLTHWNGEMPPPNPLRAGTSRKRHMVLISAINGTSKFTEAIINVFTF